MVSLDTRLKMSALVRPFLLYLLATCALAWSLKFNKRQTSIQSTQQNTNCFYSLCNETQDYPAEKLRRILTNTKNYSEIFGSNVIEPLLDISNKFAFDQENVCKIRTITMYPQRGKTIAGKLRTIVNDEQHTQGLTFDICVESEASCLQKSTLASGHRTFCKQQFVIVRMLALNENEEIKLQKFQVPSGCNCYLQR